MRSSDAYIGLLAAVMGFGAVVLRAEHASWWPISGVLAIVVLLLGVMVWAHVHEPRVLIVGDPHGGRLYRMRDAIDRAGFAMRSCPGPEVHDCPAMHGRPCPVHNDVKAVLISTSGSYKGSVPPCGDALHVAAVELHDPDAVRATLGDLLGPEECESES